MTGLLLVLAIAGALGVLLLFARLRRAHREIERHQTALERTIERVEHIERAFQRFAPLEIVEQFAQGDAAHETAYRQVTIMFADLKGFTAMSERIEPDVMVEMLNGYFRAMNRALTEHHGHLSRLMGDGLMALFGSFDHNPWQAADAVRAALAMRAALAEYNGELALRGLPSLAFGVGLNSGQAVAGVMGSDHLMEFTVIGDAVNLAARVESLTRELGVDILVTEPVRAALDERFAMREMQATVVKGKSEPIVTFAVESFDERSSDARTT
jgi:class 3 adenylate cyclase